VTGTSREAEEKKAIARLCGELQRGRLSRRKFLSRLGYLGITASFGPTILADCGGGKAKRKAPRSEAALKRCKTGSKMWAVRSRVPPSTSCPKQRPSKKGN